MAKKETLTALQISTEVKKKHFSPIYVLMGEEAYYIDYISELILNGALTEDERDFNFTLFYGLDSDVRDVISACKRYPAMSQYQVIMVREVQMMKEIDMLQHYVSQPLKSTILILCCKGGNLKAPEFTKLAKASNDVVFFESKKLKEYNIERVILDYVTEKDCTITQKAISMLKDYIGTDIARLFGEINKLTILLSNTKEITPDLIEKNIGISKDYNNFELETAIRERNALKAFKIIDYYEKNPKSNPTVLSNGLLFSFFSNLLLVHTCKDRSERGLLEQLDSKSAYRVNVFKEATKVYSAAGCVSIIGFIRDFDIKSKGMGSRQNEFGLLKELIYKILHCR